MNLKGRSFITLKDYTPEEINYLLDLAADLKAKKKSGVTGSSLKGKNIALIFEKPSTRTRCSFVVAAVDEGAHPEYLGKDDIQLGHKESVEDTARVLEESLTVSNSADSSIKRWKIWRNTPACRCGTV